ncbi:MAG: acetate--CoA ligase family protein [Candidatus ainarchaeum sp.]|nr:acetate--CoA ligase family protein [Candidatus ainarchaeum sp.]
MSLLDDFKLMEKNNFKLIPYYIAKSEEEAVSISEKIGYPVAMKIVSDDIPHKTDFGGVKINLKNELAVRLAYKEISDNVKKFKIEGILIQKMARKGVELIIGGKKDPTFGHMIVLGLGGIYVEVFRDITARICPIKKEDVIEMVYELRSHPLITGTRGKKSINMKSLEDLMLKTCKLMKTENLVEIDLNPIIFDSKGCDIVDVRFKK